MNIIREDKEINFDDVIISDHISLHDDDFRLCQTYIGGIHEGDTEDIETCMGCVIELHEITAHNRVIIPALLAKLTDDGIDAEIYSETIYNTFPDVRQTLAIEDYSDYGNTQKIVETIINTLQEFDKVA